MWTRWNRAVSCFEVKIKSQHHTTSWTFHSRHSSITNTQPIHPRENSHNITPRFQSKVCRIFTALSCSVEFMYMHNQVACHKSQHHNISTLNKKTFRRSCSHRDPRWQSNHKGKSCGVYRVIIREKNRGIYLKEKTWKRFSTDRSSRIWVLQKTNYELIFNEKIPLRFHIHMPKWLQFCV